MKKKFVIGGIVVFILGFGLVFLYYGYLYKGGRNISSEKPSFTLTANELVAEYSRNQPKADSIFLNKTLEIKGVVTQVTDSVLTIDSLAFCDFGHKPAKNILKTTITIKGRCIGYDELFNEVKLDQCTLKY